MLENQSVCEECGKIIEKVTCRTHDESFEVGHADNCSHKPVKESCVVEK